MTDLLPVPSTAPAADAPTPWAPTPWRRVHSRRGPGWTRRYAVSLVMIDLGAVLVAVVGAYWLRFGLLDGHQHHPDRYLLLCIGLVLGWVLALAATGAYEARHITTGVEEFKRVLAGTAVVAGGTAIVCYGADVEIARGFVFGVVPIGVALLVAGRSVSRRLVQAHRALGGWSYRIVVAGTSASVQQFVRMTTKTPGAGLTVIGACVEDTPVGETVHPGVPVLGGVTEVAAAAARVGADVVALSGAGLGAATVRRLGWELEGTGLDLVMVPGLTEVAGPRVHVTAVQGLPFMWVDRPALRGYRRILKRALDLAVAGTLLVLLAPLFAVIALLIRCDSRGPVFFRQTRYGRWGREFRIWKFRSMTDDAASRHHDVMAAAGARDLFAKVRSDPRVTRVGRVLRALSLDELPQLANVLAGSMSLVGPRPQCDWEVETYDDATSRRLLVQPGMTGLWQVSGRSDLAAEDGVRLDLYYVENWSLTMDVAIVLRTVETVLRRRGAY